MYMDHKDIPVLEAERGPLRIITPTLCVIDRLTSQPSRKQTRVENATGSNSSCFCLFADAVTRRGDRPYCGSRGPIEDTHQFVPTIACRARIEIDVVADTVLTVWGY